MNRKVIDLLEFEPRWRENCPTDFIVQGQAETKTEMKF